MKLEVILNTPISKSLREGLVSVVVTMDKEMIEQINFWLKGALEVSYTTSTEECLEIIADILKEAQRGCDD